LIKFITLVAFFYVLARLAGSIIGLIFKPLSRHPESAIRKEDERPWDPKDVSEADFEEIKD